MFDTFTTDELRDLYALCARRIEDESDAIFACGEPLSYEAQRRGRIITSLESQRAQIRATVAARGESFAWRRNLDTEGVTNARHELATVAA